MRCMACGQRAAATVARKGVEVAFCTIHMPAKLMSIAR